MATAWTLGLRPIVFRDMAHAGAGRILGTVKIDGDPVDTPVKRKVRLYRDVDGLKIGETWSDAVTGAYSFNSIDPGYRYTVISYDHLNSYRAVVADNLTPEPMP